MQKYFGFRVQWSQTDYDYILVKAEDEKQALLHMKIHYHDARYVTLEARYRRLDNA